MESGVSEDRKWRSCVCFRFRFIVLKAISCDIANALFEWATWFLIFRPSCAMRKKPNKDTVTDELWQLSSKLPLNSFVEDFISNKSRRNNHYIVIVIHLTCCTQHIHYIRFKC